MQTYAPGLLSRTPVHEGRIVRLSLDRVRFPGGSEGTLELIRHAGAAAIVPFLDPPDSSDPRILLVHQYRYAAGGYIHEVPAGMPDGPDEPWEAVARRELEEETGYVAGDLRYLTSILTTPGFTDEAIHLFAASSLEAGAANRDRDEFMEVVELPFSRAIRMVREGRIVDAKSLSALLYLKAFLPDAWENPGAAPVHSRGHLSPGVSPGATASRGE